MNGFLLHRRQKDKPAFGFSKFHRCAGIFKAIPGPLLSSGVEEGLEQGNLFLNGAGRQAIGLHLRKQGPDIGRGYRAATLVGQLVDERESRLSRLQTAYSVDRDR
ncbi:MAG: hypothetical protein GZ085_08350 [Sulfuriferula multivorans]|uniref:Uncharacterized protein n=1 Tax=Sulfuriferula multivorans TaxID=1559896 RepID=A0A7C9P3D3_9PROT|nr:hypothetical protein [Sulfuriferula multivorans]